MGLQLQMLELASSQASTRNSSFSVPQMRICAWSRAYRPSRNVVAHGSPPKGAERVPCRKQRLPPNRAWSRVTTTRSKNRPHHPRFRGYQPTEFQKTCTACKHRATVRCESCHRPFCDNCLRATRSHRSSLTLSCSGCLEHRLARSLSPTKSDSPGEAKRSSSRERLSFKRIVDTIDDASRSKRPSRSKSASEPTPKRPSSPESPSTTEENDSESSMGKLKSFFKRRRSTSVNPAELVRDNSTQILAQR